MDYTSHIWSAWAQGRTGKDILPFDLVDIQDEEELLKWLENAAFVLEEESQEKNYLQVCMRLAYRGYFDTTLLGGTVTRGGTVATLRQAEAKRMTLNHYRTHIEQCIDRIVSLPVDIIASPATDEVADKNSSIVVQSLLETASYRLGASKLHRKVARHAMVEGEGWVRTYWNDFVGPKQKDVDAALRKKQPVRKIDKDGKVTKDLVERAPRIGDVDIKVPLPWNVFTYQEASGERVLGIFEKKLVHVERLKKDYDIEKQSQNYQGARLFNVNSMVYSERADLVEVWEFHHSRTEELPDGFYAKFIEGVLIEKGPLPTPEKEEGEFQDLPYVRLAAVDADADDWCQPTSLDMAILQHAINQLTTIQRRNAWYGANPRIVSKKGSARREDWINSPTWSEYNGDTPPALLTYNLLSGELTALRTQFVLEQREFAGNFGASRGDPPPNTRSAEQLAFYAEEEQKRAAGPIKRFQEFVLEYNKNLLSLMAKHYKPDDGRTMLYLGLSEEPLFKPYDLPALDKPWNLRLTTGDNLSLSPTIRMNQLIQIRKEAPSLLSDEEFADKAQLGSLRKVYTTARAAIGLADYEEQQCMQGRPIPEPQDFQEHVTHWGRHRKFMQTLSFLNCPKESIQEMKDHVMTHEYLMLEIARGNLIYFQRILQLEGFPMIFRPEKDLNSLYNALAQAQAGTLPEDGAALPAPVQAPQTNYPGAQLDQGLQQEEMQNG